MKRRDLLRGATATAAAMAMIDTLMADTNEPQAKHQLKQGSIVLFQGDSITDVGRNKEINQANSHSGFGRGYPMLIGSQLLMEYPEFQLEIFNRGISGHKVPDLDKRWQKDCIDLKPNLLSILIGVNDIWHKLNGKYDGTVETYEAGLKALLQRTRVALPELSIVVCEPFVLRCGAVSDDWFPEFDDRRKACNRVAESMNLTLVEFQSMFNKACEKAPPTYWAHDGVHPTMAGHALMAATWRKTVGV